MNTYQLTLFVLFSIVAYMMVVDKNVAEWINLKFQALGIEVRRRWLMFKLHPRNPVTNWIMERKMKKLSQELLNEIRQRQEEDQ